MYFPRPEPKSHDWPKYWIWHFLNDCLFLFRYAFSWKLTSIDTNYLNVSPLESLNQLNFETNFTNSWRPMHIKILNMSVWSITLKSIMYTNSQCIWTAKTEYYANEFLKYKRLSGRHGTPLKIFQTNKNLKQIFHHPFRKGYNGHWGDKYC